ncbi:hypothetical protein [Microbacterium sp. LMI1-1-1.1]|uniref:hypothetical protein n=1 Tax=Microbacterium sp. LMI1-1-1.1 TaxID=3135223 RepID=UPI003465856D
MSSGSRFEWGGIGPGRADYVSAPEALAMLDVLVVAHADLEVETGVSAGSAWARLARGERWARVSTPGSRWFSVDVDTRHRVQLVDEASSKDESARLLAVYVEIAAAYVRSDERPRRSGLLGGSTLAVVVDGREVLLTQSWTDRLRGVLGR